MESKNKLNGHLNGQVNNNVLPTSNACLNHGSFLDKKITSLCDEFVQGTISYSTTTYISIQLLFMHTTLSRKPNVGFLQVDI